MNEVHERLAPGQPDTVRDRYFRSWWRSVKNDLAGLHRPEEFSPRLWRAAASAGGWLESDSGFAPAASLKPKFMLRQFVDEMHDTDLALALTTLAYSPLSESAAYASTDAMELADIIYEAVIALHETVARFESSLDAMADHSVSIAGLSDPASIARTYTGWLFLSR
jgi:hypothetical protein